MTAIARLPWRLTDLGLPTIPTVPGGEFDTAAAVYAKSSDTLVRQLFAGISKTLSALTAGVIWPDGLDNGGNTVSGATSDYEVRAVTSKLAFEYLGNAGNSGPLTATVSQPYDPRYPGGRPANSPVQYGFRRMHYLTIVGGRVYFGKAYAEGPPSHGFFTLADPQTNGYYQTPPQADVLTQATIAGCNNGTLNFLAGYDGYNLGPWFIYATSLADGEQVTRSAGVSLKVGGGGITYKSVILTGARITGVAVSGNYLYATLADSTVKVYRVDTFALVRTIPLYKPVAIATDGAGDLVISYRIKGSTDTTPVLAPPSTLR